MNFLKPASIYRLKSVIKSHEKEQNLKKRKIKDILHFPLSFICCFGWNLFKSKEQEKYKNNLSIVSIFKNESEYLKEWIEYHKLIGVTKFYLYNNESTDDYLTVLKPYIQNGIVELIDMPGKARQMDAYNDCLNKHKNDTKYLAVIDVDEFVFSKNYDIPKLLNSFFLKHKKAAGLTINWMIFGSSNKEKKENDFVINRFKYRSKDDFEKNKHIKTIVNPRRTLGFENPHYACYLEGFKAYDINGKIINGPLNDNTSTTEIIRINHYFTKSREEFLIKRNRGYADQNGIRDLKQFNEHDKNDVYDDTMNKYIEKIKETYEKL